MTWDQYWYGDVCMAEAFREADKLRQERQNNEAWLQGVYFARAIQSTICNAFRSKGSEPDKYPDQPFDLYGNQKNQEKTEEQEEQEAVWALAWMQTFVAAGARWGPTVTPAQEGATS